MRYELTSRGGDMLSKEYLDTARTLRRERSRHDQPNDCGSASGAC
jgi:hypothetical protein